MSAYNVIREIGRGGFGVVEEVTSASDSLSYARKTLVYPNHIAKSDMRKRFDREIRYQKAIKHPNVVIILHENLTDDPPWFVMPLAEGSLAQELMVDRRLNGRPEKALFDILAGLEEIHRAGYKHRDLSPGNVLRYRDPNGDPFYAVSDFGLIAGEAGKTTTLTDTNAGGGTPKYRAPECANDFKRATIKADIYSFGAILHDIFGVGPRIPHTELTAPGPIGRVIEKCTKTNIHRRYRDIGELRTDLHNALANTNFSNLSSESSEAINLLNSKDSLTDDEWDKISDIVDRSTDRSEVYRILSQFRSVHFDDLAANAPGIFQSIAIQYCEFARTSSFEFSFCDVIGANLEGIFAVGDAEVRAQVGLALLSLGTSHNRWHVERIFARNFDPSCAETIVDRLLVEAAVLQYDLKDKLAQLQASIGIGNADLHPKLAI